VDPGKFSDKFSATGNRNNTLVGNHAESLRESVESAGTFRSVLMAVLGGGAGSRRCFQIERMEEKLLDCAAVENGPSKLDGSCDFVGCIFFMFDARSKR
jgi:hypothetical protein